jgi:hypothetical protein
MASVVAIDDRAFKTLLDTLLQFVDGLLRRA